jgi:hypothetical protein
LKGLIHRYYSDTEDTDYDLELRSILGGDLNLVQDFKVAFLLQTDSQRIRRANRDVNPNHVWVAGHDDKSHTCGRLLGIGSMPSEVYEVITIR